jgi:hypothetical protein
MTEKVTAEATVPVDPTVAAWSSLWRAVRPNATYNHNFGFERSWRGQWQDWGYPLEDNEITISLNGQTYQARNFHKVGLVYWDPAKGAEVYGRP